MRGIWNLSHTLRLSPFLHPEEEETFLAGKFGLKRIKLKDEDQEDNIEEDVIKKVEVDDIIDNDEEIDSEEEWTPPEFVNCVKFFMDGFKDADMAQTTMRQILNDNDMKIKKLKVLPGMQNKFRRMYGIEIEDFKHTSLETVKEAIRKNYDGVAFDIKYTRTIDKFKSIQQFNFLPFPHVLGNRPLICV